MYLPSRSFLGFCGCHILIHVIRVLAVLIWAACQGQRHFPWDLLCGPVGRWADGGQTVHVDTPTPVPPARGSGPGPRCHKTACRKCYTEHCAGPISGVCQRFLRGVLVLAWFQATLMGQKPHWEVNCKGCREPSLPDPPRPGPPDSPFAPTCPILPGQALPSLLKPTLREPLLSGHVPTTLLDSRHCRMDAEFW